MMRIYKTSHRPPPFTFYHSFIILYLYGRPNERMALSGHTIFPFRGNFRHQRWIQSLLAEPAATHVARSIVISNGIHAPVVYSAGVPAHLVCLVASELVVKVVRDVWVLFYPCH